MYTHIHTAAASLEKVTCGIKVSCSLTFLVVFIAAVLLIFAMPRLPEHTQIQPFEGLGSLIYAPFPNISIDGFYYNQMKVTTAVGSKNDFNNFNLTVCNVLCPLETVSNHLPTVKEASLNDRKSSNWYVNLRGWSSPVDSSSQYNSLYMLKGSLLTFSIIRLVPLTDVQLCITNSIHVCSEVYNNASNSVKAHQVCQEVLIFNKTNDHVRTFTARDTSYYCAVWVLKAYNQSLNYTVNRTIQSYKISTGPPSQCQTHKKQTKTQSFDLQRQIAIKSSPVCIVIQVAGNQLPNNITLVSTIVSSKTNNILFVLGAVFSCLSVLMFVIVLVMVCLVACEKLLTI